MATLSDLHDAIAMVCPINGIETTSTAPSSEQSPAPIDWTTRATWKIDFDPAATDAQKAAAQQVLTTFDPAAVYSVTMRQARLALIQAGLYAQVQTAAAADPTTQVWWDYSDTVERANPILNAVASQLGLTSAQVDALFKTAATL